MELQILFTALSKAIMISLVQGLIIYIFVRMALSFFTDLNASQRYRILYASLVLMFATFVYTLSRTYFDIQSNLSALNPWIFESPSLSGIPSEKIEFSITGIVGWIYLAGMATHLLYISSGIYRIRQIRRNSFSDSIWDKKLHMLKAGLEIKTQITLHLSSRMLVPFTAGFIRPVIVLPIAMINQLSPDQVEAILLHELAHIKRADYLFNILQKFIESALFFNPFMWILSKEIRIEREFSCDDLVMNENQDPILYAHALLKVAESNLSMCQSGISVAGPGKFTLLTRIKRLNDMKTIPSNPGSAIIGFIGVVLAAFSIAWINPQKPVVKPEIASLSWITTDTLGRLSKELNTPLPALQPLQGSELPVLHLSHSDTVPPPVPGLDQINPIVFVTDTDKIKKYYESAEWKNHTEVMKKHSAEMQKHFNSPEWKKHMEEMKANALEFQKYQSSPEFKKLMESAEKSALEMSLKFDNPEFKAKIELLNKSQADLQKMMASPEWKDATNKVQVESMEISKKFSTPEWKASVEQMKISGEQMRKIVESQEWKEGMEKIKTNVAEFQKKLDSPEWKEKEAEIRIMVKKMIQESDAQKKEGVRKDP